ncbi:MAG TPA: histidine ammonia-lyase [Gemmatimonadetes bacterium]|nr:histidine ammonia-lyase [Gemmatimonadota bacterium]HBE00102.1 histidine ammonia-lyase [Gemmatimonadota bacterium]HIC53568.1 histidine ammonia-lyase [Gemmatimonadota bacterium]
MSDVILDGRSLSLEDVRQVALGPETEVGLSEEAVARMADSRALIERLVSSGEPVYGVTTGFGRLADVTIPPDDRTTLQHNLVRSHASGMGDAMDREAVRALMVLRANALARGHSGCRVVLVERLLELLNSGIHPRVPEFGSVGASGDLAPLAHVALALIGEGPAEKDGTESPVQGLLADAGIEPVTLGSKEGLALINGTQATTGLGILALLAAERALETAEVAGAMSLDALLGTPEAFREEIQDARPHAGQARSAARLRALLAGSQIRESHREGDPRVQDAYSLRCMPQVHGAAREALAYVRGILETEANSATDNPLVFPEAGVVVSGGNFHAQVVSQALDLLAIAVADLAAISERRVERLLNPDLSMGLPAFLTSHAGLESGFMIVQVTAVDLLAEMRILSHPASVDSVTTSANQEDHVSMGLAAARKARRSVACLQKVLATELMCAAQGIEFRRPLRSSDPIEAAHARIRLDVPKLEGDRVLGPDLDALTDLIRSGELAGIGAEEDT